MVFSSIPFLLLKSSGSMNWLKSEKWKRDCDSHGVSNQISVHLLWNLLGFFSLISFMFLPFLVLLNYCLVLSIYDRINVVLTDIFVLLLMFFCHFIFFHEEYLLYRILWFSVIHQESAIHPCPLSSESPFHLLPHPNLLDCHRALVWVPWVV